MTTRSLVRRLAALEMNVAPTTGELIDFFRAEDGEIDPRRLRERFEGRFGKKARAAVGDCLDKFIRNLDEEIHRRSLTVPSGMDQTIRSEVAE